MAFPFNTGGNPMGYLKSLLIDQLDDDEEFRLAFEIEPELPEEIDSFSIIPSIETHRSNDHAQSLPF
jgi:hypothetical protein